LAARVGTPFYLYDAQILQARIAAVVALTVADALLEKTGGDSLDEVRRNLDAYVAGLRPAWGRSALIRL
jgi:hypothetical protein